MHAEIARTPAALPARALLAAGGKRLRARVLWWSAAATTGIGPASHDAGNLIRAAAAIELAHLSSLVHDDVVDAADTRRGAVTLHRSHGVRAATDAGTALAHLASSLLAPLGPAPRRMVRRAILAICRGQVRELSAPFVAVSLRTRFGIMQEKTATFFELAAALGAQLAGANASQRSAVRRFARRWGVAFQIADDVLDLSGDPRELGRDNGADLRDGVFTLPVLLAADQDGALAALLPQLREGASAALLARCVALIDRGDGIGRAAAVARWWLERATAALARLPESPARRALADLASTSVERGLTTSAPRFPARPAPAAIIDAMSMLGRQIASVESLTAEPHVPKRLAATLDWIAPGLAAAVGVRAREVGSIAARFERALLRGNQWSEDALLAARAIALAHALLDDSTLDADPVWTLAVADCLHCFAIATLCDGPGSGEHERMAERARLLSPRDPACPPDDASRHVSLPPAPGISLSA